MSLPKNDAKWSTEAFKEGTDWRIGAGSGDKPLEGIGV